MAIRISHGDVATLAKFAAEAGAGEQRVRAAGDAEATRRTQMQIDANLQAARIRSDTQRDMQIIDAENRREAMEFESFMAAESARRNLAWQQDKLEQSRQHDLDMLEARKEIEHQYLMQKDMMKIQEMDRKLQALDKAVEDDRISPKEAADEKLRIQIGVSGSQSPLYRETDSQDAFSRILAQMAQEGQEAPTGGARPAPQAQPVYASNPKTGERLVSYDGRQTWQKVE